MTGRCGFYHQRMLFFPGYPEAVYMLHLTMIPCLHLKQRAGSFPLRILLNFVSVNPSSRGCQMVFPINAITCCRFVLVFAVAGYRNT